MIVFFTLISKLIPLYIIIFLGFLSTKLLKAEKESIAKLLIYIIAPVVIFYGTYTAPLDSSILILPSLFFIVCCFVSLVFLLIGKILGSENKLKNILAFTSGTGNTGYFGLPVVLAIFDERAFSIAVLCILGFVLYENTLGFYLTSMGTYSPKESIKKVIQLPTIYAFGFGLLLSATGFDIGETLAQNINHFKGAYTVLGMLIIGMGLSHIKKSSFHIGFLGLCFFAKFVFWPILIAIIIAIDIYFFQYFSNEIHDIMLVMSIVPLAANTIALATELDAHPEEATIAVFLSTIFALFYIPLVIAVFI